MRAAKDEDWHPLAATLETPITPAARIRTRDRNGRDHRTCGQPWDALYWRAAVRDRTGLGTFVENSPARPSLRDAETAFQRCHPRPGVSYGRTSDGRRMGGNPDRR